MVYPTISSTSVLLPNTHRSLPTSPTSSLQTTSPTSPLQNRIRQSALSSRLNNMTLSSKIEDLSNELLGEIFSNLRRRDLVACARTSKWWTAEAHRKLFKTICLDRWSTMKQVVRVLERNEHMEPLVKNILISCLDDPEVPCVRSQVTIKRLFAVTTYCSFLGILCHEREDMPLGLLDIAYALLMERTRNDPPLRIWVDPQLYWQRHFAVEPDCLRKDERSISILLQVVGIQELRIRGPFAKGVDLGVGIGYSEAITTSLTSLHMVTSSGVECDVLILAELLPALSPRLKEFRLHTIMSNKTDHGNFLRVLRRTQFKQLRKLRLLLHDTPTPTAPLMIQHCRLLEEIQVFEGILPAEVETAKEATARLFQLLAGNPMKVVDFHPTGPFFKWESDLEKRKATQMALMESSEVIAMFKKHSWNQLETLAINSTGRVSADWAELAGSMNVRVKRCSLRWADDWSCTLEAGMEERDDPMRSLWMDSTFLRDNHS